MTLTRLYSLVSTFLIAIPILVTIYIFYPVILTEWNYYNIDKSEFNTIPKSSEFGIIIPNLGINEIIIPNIDPFNSFEYFEALTKGVAHAKGTQTPNNPGSTYLFAHSSDNPFALTRYNTAFYLLPKLKSGDLIQIYFKGEMFEYKVIEQKIVKPHEVEYLTKIEKDLLILQTCTPAGTSINRLLVFAKKV